MTTDNSDETSSDEIPLEPELPICDPHHHLWERPPRDYLLDELLQDLQQRSQRGFDSRGRMPLRLSQRWPRRVAPGR